MNTSEIFDFGQLAEAAYGNFFNDDLQIVIKDESAVQLILRGLKSDPAKNQLVEDEDSDMSFSKTQAIQFTDAWSVVAHQPDTDSGFSATLFRNRGSGEQVYAIRGTAGLNDLVLTDGGDIVTDGLAIHQIVDLYNDWQRLKAGAGNPYPVKVLELLPLETVLLGAEVGPADLVYKATLSTRDDIVIDEPSGRVYTLRDGLSTIEFSDDRRTGVDGGINAAVTAAGHSLGGHLAMAFSRLFGGEALSVNGAGYVTGNLPALGFFGEANIRNLFSMLGGAGADSFNRTKIHNIYGSVAPEVITQNGPYLHQQGSHDELWIESFSLSNIVGHGAGQMTDSLAVAD